ASAQIDSLLERLAAMVREWNYPHQDVVAVRLALNEALDNALTHGHRGDTSKSACVCASISAREVVVCVQDEGPGFNPAALADLLCAVGEDQPSVRGLQLMRNCTTALYYNSSGNRVTFKRRRSPSHVQTQRKLLSLPWCPGELSSLSSCVA